MPDPKQMYHLEPIWTRDRALVPETPFTAAEATKKRAELSLLGIDTRRPYKVGDSPCRDADGQRRPTPVTKPRRPVQRWEAEDE